MRVSLGCLPLHFGSPHLRLAHAARQLPLLRRTSPAPLIHHLSSLAAVFPAPTRALYSATKAGGLAVFRTAAWEQPQAGDGDGTGKGRTRTVRFLAILPGTIDTAFRRKSASALEGHKPSEEYEKRTLTVEQSGWSRWRPRCPRHDADSPFSLTHAQRYKPSSPTRRAHLSPAPSPSRSPLPRSPCASRSSASRPTTPSSSPRSRTASRRS